MKIWRNPEFRRELRWYFAGTALFSLIGFFIRPVCGLMLMSACAFFIFIYMRYAKKRYRAIAELSQSIDRILHGQERLLIADSSEGELSILISEVQKMTVRLRESSDLLIADKQRMTDAIADVSHQFRTPLTSMNLVVSLLTEEDISTERRIKLTCELKKQLQRIEWLVETLLKMSKIDAGTVIFRSDTVDVAELVRKAVEPLAISMELRSQTLSVSVDNEKFKGDLLWSTEAIGNILKNCMEHTPANGIIEISARETLLFTEIIVRDNGTGFEKEDLPHIFERFYKGKNAASESVGIGLAFSRMVITAQNGTVDAGNAAEGGARFIIRFYKSVV